MIRSSQLDQQLGELVEVLELAPAAVELDDVQTRLAQAARGTPAPSGGETRRISRKPGESKPLPWPSTWRTAWYSHGDMCSSMSSWPTTYSRQQVRAAQERARAGAISPRSIRRVAFSTSVQASFSHSSDAWWTVWKSSSSWCARSSGGFCSESSSSVRR